LTEEQRLRAFENKVLRRIFQPRKDEMTGGWLKPHNEELQNLYSSPSIIRMIKSRMMSWARQTEKIGEKYTWWVDKIKLDLLREEGSCKHGNEPSGPIKCTEILE
jgi:hypothetical protein